MRTTTKTQIPTPPVPTTAARDAAQIVLGLVERLAPTDDRPAFRARLHEAAQAFQRALETGASMDAVLAHLITATAPPVEAPPFEPWRSLLSMTFDEFAESGVGLHVALAKLGEGIWLVGDEVTQTRVVRETRVWDRFVKLPFWMAREADSLPLPEDQRTVGGFIAAIEGRVVGWRPPEAW